MRERRPRPSWARQFGDRVRQERLRLGLSQERLGEAAGLHRTFVGRVEQGCTNVTLRTILHLADTLGVDAATLVDGLEPESRLPSSLSNTSSRPK